MDTSKTSMKVWAGWAITIVVAASMMFIPESALVTPELKKFLAVTIFAIMLVVFSLTDALVTGIVLFMGYAVLGVAGKDVIFAAWQNDVAWIIIGSLVLGNILEASGIMKRIAIWIIRKTGGSYTKMLWGIYIAALAVAFLTSVTGFPLFAPLIFGICLGLGYEIGTKEANGVVFAAMTGALAPFVWLYNPINAGVGSAVINMFDPNLSITWFSYLKVACPWFLFDLFWMVLITKVFFKSNTKVDPDYFESEYKKLGPVSSQEKKAAALAILVVGYLIFASFSGMSTSYAFTLLPWIAFLPGVNLGNAAILKKTNFSIVIFTVGCLAIGNVGTAVGVGALITETITPMLAGASTLSYTFGVWLIATLSNFLLTPVAVTTALGVPMMQIGVDLGVSPVATLFTMLMNTSNVFLPHENTGYLMYFAMGLFTIKDFLKYNTVRMILCTVFMMAVIVPYWYFIGVL